MERFVEIIVRPALRKRSANARLRGLFDGWFRYISDGVFPGAVSCSHGAWAAQRVDERIIGPDLRERYPNLFDLLETDDALSFQGVAEG